MTLTTTCNYLYRQKINIKPCFFFLPFFHTFNTTFLINKNENIPHKIREAKTTNKKKRNN